MGSPVVLASIGPTNHVKLGRTERAAQLIDNWELPRGRKLSDPQGSLLFFLLGNQVRDVVLEGNYSKYLVDFLL